MTAGNNLEEITLSIFVPCFNEENDITKALDNIKEGIQNVEYEVLVTDDGSTDKTVELIQKFKKNNPNVNIKIFCNEVRTGIFPSSEFCYIKTKKNSNNVTYLKFNEKK